MHERHRAHQQPGPFGCRHGSTIARDSGFARSPDQLPDVQARVSFNVEADWETGYDEFLMVDEPAVIADTFETLRKLDPNECAGNDEHPGISYQPAPVGDTVLAWELYGGPTNVERFIAVQ